MLIYTLHSAFEDAKEPFNSIGMNRLIFWIDVFTTAMMHNAVLCKVLSNVNVLSSIIRHNAGIAIYVCLNNRKDGCCFQVINNHTTGATSVTINQAKNFVLVSVAASLLDAARLNG